MTAGGRGRPGRQATVNQDDGADRPLLLVRVRPLAHEQPALGTGSSDTRSADPVVMALAQLVRERWAHERVAEPKGR
jgi:hypothetical protein